MVEYEDTYYNVVFGMPGYTDAYKIRNWDLAMEKYKELLEEHKKDENFYKDIHIDIVTEVRNRITILK